MNYRSVYRFLFRCNRTRQTSSSMDTTKVNDNAIMWSLYFETDVSCISGTIYIFVIVHQPEEEWRRTNFGTSRPENKTSCSWLWNTFDYLGLSIVNDTSQPIETKLVGVNMGESVEQIVKIYGAQRIWDKNEKILSRLINLIAQLIPRWIETICKNSAFLIMQFDCSYHC